LTKINPMNDWFTIIGQALKEVLPGEISHRKMLPPGRELSLPDEIGTGVTSCGVLMLIYPEGNELFTCLIKRQSFLKHHAGQVGFPGGKMEECDVGHLQAAVRETSEEIGIQYDKIQVLGALSPLFIPVSGFMIYPFIAWSPSRPRFTINRDEVEKIILFPLLGFIKNRKTTEVYLETLTGGLKVPAILFDHETIWGATAMILTEFIDMLDRYINKEQRQ
jgi:8-oxo-dGTP pyrophosphatase MutT (NUDIX family)